MLNKREYNTLLKMVSLIRSPIEYGGDKMIAEDDIVSLLEEFVEIENQ